MQQNRSFNRRKRWIIVLKNVVSTLSAAVQHFVFSRISTKVLELQQFNVHLPLRIDIDFCLTETEIKMVRAITLKHIKDPKILAEFQNESMWSLLPNEELWRDRYNILLRNGYRLRSRFRPDWVPSWKGTDLNPYHCEDAFGAAVCPQSICYFGAYGLFRDLNVSTQLA